MATFGDLLAAAGQAVGDNKIDAKKAQEMIAAGDCIVLNVQDGSSKIPNAYDASLEHFLLRYVVTNFHAM